MAHDSLTDVLTPGAANALQAFSKHVGDSDAWRLRGGAAIRYWTADGRPPATELDTATKSLYAVPSTVFSSFDAEHLHRPNSGGLHYGKFVHKPTDTGVDVFTQELDSPPAVMVPFGEGGLELPVEGPAPLLAVGIKWLLRHVTTEYGFGPHDKRIAAVCSLARVVDWDEVEKLWSKRAANPAELAIGAADALDWAVQQARWQRGAKTSLLGHVARQIASYCRGCDRFDPRYPLVSPGTTTWRKLCWRIAGAK